MLFRSLATTHYMDEAEYCNTIGMMYQAQLVALASPERLKDEFPGVLIQFACADLLRAAETADQVPGVLDTSVHGVRLRVAVRDERVVGVLKKALVLARLDVTEFEVILPSLEDVFISMIEARLKAAERGG